mgnify:FL=1
MTSSNYNFDATLREISWDKYTNTKTIWSKVGANYNYKDISNKKFEVFKDLKPEGNFLGEK